MIVPGVGSSGQAALRNSRAVVVGAGGLGCPVLQYLAGAGLGSITIVDDDEVAVNNLHRQVLHSMEFVGKPKVESARVRLQLLNPLVEVTAVRRRLDATNARELLEGHDIIVNCTDNAVVRYVISDAAVLLQTPVVSGSALQGYGQLAVLCHNGGPCYRCIFPTAAAGPQQSCADNGVLGPTVGTLGSMQAMEAIKVLLQSPNVLSGKLLMVDLELGSFRSVKVPRNDACLACGTASTLSWAQLEAQGTSDTACALIAPNKSKVSDDHRTSCEAYVKERHGPHILLDVRDPSQFAVCALPNALNVPLRHLSARVEEVKAKGLPGTSICTIHQCSPQPLIPMPQFSSCAGEESTLWRPQSFSFRQESSG